jgi:diguanylate cyclase (GGDEF)-like protein
MKRFGLIRVLACWIALSSVTQAQQYVFRSFRQAEGLNNLAVNALARDRSGFLWLATENGVYRFLGSGFERYGAERGVAELDILDIVSDPNGTIWVATEGNLYRWDGQRFLPAGRDPIRIESQRRMIVEDAYHLLVVLHGHIYRLEHDAQGRMLSFLPLYSDHMLASMPDLAHVISLSAVREPQNGLRIWAGCGTSLCSWLGQEDGNAGQQQDGTVTEWGKDKGLAADRWEGVLLDRAGTLWAGGVAHVAVLPRGSPRFVDRSIHGSDPESNYGHSPLIEDGDGRVLTPSGDGIARWDGGAWKIIGRANGMERARRIMGMAFDAAGDLWFVSRGDGLFEWTGYGEWEGWSDVQGLPSAGIWAIAPGGADRFFVGTERGVAWIDARTGSLIPLSALRKWNYGQVSGMGTDSDGSLWVATHSGAVLRVDPRTGHTQQTAKVPDLIFRAAKDASGRLFFETPHGLYLREPGAGNSVPHRIPAADALMGDSTWAAASCESADGTDWFGVGYRLLRFKAGRWTAPVIQGLPKQNENLTALSCARDGVVWLVDGEGGAWRLTPSGDRLQAWQLVLPPGLRTLAPLAVLVDRRGWVWLGSDLGLAVWNGHDWRHVTQESGLIWDDVNQGIMSEAPDGSLWIGTSNGVAHLQHPERVFDSIPLVASLTEIRRGETSYLGAQQITMTWEGSPLKFRISSPTMRNRSELAVKIRMVGYQSEWMETRDGNATFSRLPPGEYTFMGMVCNPGLNACSNPVRVDIKVLPPWWRTNWFYGLCVLVFLLLLAAVIYLYTRRMGARSRELEMLVSERTRELEASRAQLRIQATHDGLTGMLNRTAILRALGTELDRAQRESLTVAVALVDLDFFKGINDNYGHLAGDEALRWFASAVGTAIRPYDLAGRYGGEEFLLVLTKLPREIVENRLVSLHGAISNLKICTHGSEFQLNCSMGATVFEPSDGPATVESLLMIADHALYAAKAEGRNRVVFRPVDYSDSHLDSHEQPFSSD